MPEIFYSQGKSMSQLLKIFIKSRMIPLVLVVLLCVPAVYALTVPGFYGASDDVHIAWVYEMVRTLKAGQIPPRYVPDLSFGFGYPLFNFVFPLPYYLGAVLNFIGLSLVDSVKIVFGLSLVLSGMTMYLLLKELLGNMLGVAGATVYVYAPYRAIDVYFRGDIGEAVAFVFFPLILLALYKLGGEGSSKKWVGMGALSVAGLILSHNIAAYMFMPFVLLFVLVDVLLIKVSVRRWGVGVLVMLLLGFMGAVYFWLPAIIDSRLVRYDTVFNYADNFPSLLQLFAPYLTSHLVAPDPYGGQSFYLGLSGIVLLLVSMVVFVARRVELGLREKGIFLWAIISFTLAVFMMNFRSFFLWQHLPFFPYFQFPWRFLMMTAFVVPFWLVVFSKTTQRIVSILTMVVAVGTTFQMFKPHDFLSRTDQYYLNRYIPVPSASEDYKLTKEEYLRLPLGAQIKPEKEYPSVYPQEKVLRITKQDLFATTAVTVSDKPFWLSASRYALPGWVAYVNDGRAPIIAGQPFGQVEVLVPSGTNKVRILFEETLLKKILDFFALGAILLSLILVFEKKVPIL